jgi:putative nucleotidyltransferase with HDIG domain
MADRLGRQFEALKTINDIDQAIFASLDREGIVDAVLDRMPYLLPCDCFAVTLFRDVQSSGWVRLRNTPNGKPATSTLNTSITAADLQSLHDNPEVCAISEVQRVPAFLLPLREAGMASFLILPILVDGTVFAALVCADGNTLRIAADNVHHARQVADQLAVAFSNVQMIEALEQLHWGSLTALARAIDAKSAWTSGHSERVTNLALKIGQAMKLPAKELKIMHRGGLLHDIGKIGTPPNILDKPGKLEPEEMQVMRDHVQIGVRILEPIPGFQEAMPIVAQHHEWFDGSGYPAGLAGENISLHARIFAVADCFDALTSDRPYRKGLPKQQVAEMLREKSGIQFDPMVIEVFTRLCGQEESSTVDQLARRAAAGQLA